MHHVYELIVENINYLWLLSIYDILVHKQNKHHVKNLFQHLFFFKAESFYTVLRLPRFLLIIDWRNGLAPSACLHLLSHIRTRLKELPCVCVETTQKCFNVSFLFRLLFQSWLRYFYTQHFVIGFSLFIFSVTFYFIGCLWRNADDSSGLLN